MQERKEPFRVVFGPGYPILSWFRIVSLAFYLSFPFLASGAEEGRGAIDLIAEAISDRATPAISLGDLSEQDYDLKWKGPPLAGVQFHLGEGSVDWVRVFDILVLPRARLFLEVTGADSGGVRYSDFSQPLELSGESQSPNRLGRAEFSVVLLSGVGKEVHLSFIREGKRYEGDVVVAFRPRPQFKDPSLRIFRDLSCASLGLSAQVLEETSSAHWMMLGCRLYRSRSEGFETPSVEVWAVWDQGEQVISLGDVSTGENSTRLWSLRLHAGQSGVRLGSQKAQVQLGTQLPQIIHRGALGLGIGPYQFHFDGNRENVNFISPLATLYSSYHYSDTTKFVGFGIFSLEKHHYLDVGIYVRLENFRLLDRRVGVHLLFGGHAFGFVSDGKSYLGASAPQGFEITGNDLFGKGSKVALGAFIYPSIGKESYYNAWLRWGRSVFVELNYLAWETSFQNRSFSSSMVGLALGFPVLKFL
jgi:hypothetical protein